MKLCAELEATEFKEKNHKLVNFCSILEKMVLMCSEKGIGLHICIPNIHSSPTQGGGSLSLMFR